MKDRILLDDENLFDPGSEPLTYFGIDRTAEINELFRNKGQKDVTFAKAVRDRNNFFNNPKNPFLNFKVGELFYGEDLWYWMLTDGGSRRLGERKSLKKRDPEGVSLIESKQLQLRKTVQQNNE